MLVGVVSGGGGGGAAAAAAAGRATVMRARALAPFSSQPTCILPCRISSRQMTKELNSSTQIL
jgi:hypothetical protein